MRAIGILIWIDGIGWSALVALNLARYIANGWDAGLPAVMFVLAPFLGVFAALGSPWFCLRYVRASAVLIGASTVLLMLCTLLEGMPLPG